MLISFKLWEFLAGLGILLLAMMLLETALDQLADRPFKKFLRRHNNHPVKAILSGILIATFLQSSSIVSLMVLASSLTIFKWINRELIGQREKSQ